ncbi:MAG TPA: hypothetical protein VKX17_19270 [Planctomycetota bacterium]|nr:hypothetical protein [Planctomycetota bacterium]
MATDRDATYLSIIIEPIKVCANYKPKLGQGAGVGLSLDEFQTLYRSDPFYSWFGLDNPLMYAAHKAAGGMTSIYRQIGIGCERLIRTILQDEIGLNPEEVSWSYQVPRSGNKVRTLSLDCRIPLESVKEAAKREQVRDWILKSAAALQVKRPIAKSLQGVVFEVRQGYKSKDSKRQNADLANAATAYTQAYLPCAMILSSQIDSDIVIRYKSEKWAILTGTLAGNSLTSTYRFMQEIVGYDLAGFFGRHKEALNREVAVVLQALLNAN